MNKKTIQSANLHAATTHARAKADAVEGKASHTPGPWVPCPGLAGSRFRIETMRVNNDCEPVAECKGPDREANARLIAAAPELLEALEEAATWMDDDKGGDLPHTDPMMRRIYSAIAKARGATVLELITARAIAKAKGSL